MCGGRRPPRAAAAAAADGAADGAAGVEDTSVGLGRRALRWAWRCVRLFTFIDVWDVALWRARFDRVQVRETRMQARARVTDLVSNK
jgi:hypothetical protein